MPEHLQSNPDRALVDFVIVGAMKSGTSTLHDWLGQNPALSMCSWKEPSFFSVEERWNRGVEWYEGLYQPVSDDLRRGEASTSYTDPRYADVAAERMAKLAPAARLIYLVRDPLDRARSHYRHQVQRGREKRPLLEALGDESALYLAQSKYWMCLQPYTERFPRDQILVIRLDDLTGGSEATWRSVQRHVGAPAQPRPTTVKNVTAEKSQYTWLMRWLWERDLLPSTSSIPKPLRDLGRKALTRDDGAYQRLIEGSQDPVPDAMVEGVWADIADLQQWLGSTGPLWR